MIAATHFEWQIVREQIGDRKKLTIECDPMLTFALAPVIAFESLSGHIPCSWLRSSDLLPFYHQYPAACCGDFLFRLPRGRLENRVGSGHLRYVTLSNAFDGIRSLSVRCMVLTIGHSWARFIHRANTRMNIMHYPFGEVHTISTGRVINPLADTRRKSIAPMLVFFIDEANPDGETQVMDTIETLRTFVRVVETGSLSAVAREMNGSQSTISRHINQLEEHFGVRLLHRTTRHLSLTDDGAGLNDHAKRVLESVDGMEMALGQHKSSPTGHVRVATPVS